MIKDVNLISYLPPFLQKFKEYELIMDAENPEYQLLVDESERLKNNQYILTADSEGLAKFESFFNFNVEEDEDLEFRRSRLMSHWNDIYPYTYESLISKLRSLHGGNPFTLNPRFNEYELDITTNLERPGQVFELDNLLDYMMPVNIKLKTYNEIYCFAEGNAYSAAGLVEIHLFEFTDAYNIDFSLEGNHDVASQHSTTHIRELTDSYDSNYQLDGTHNIGSHQSITKTNELTDSYHAEMGVDSKVGVAGGKSGTVTVELTDSYEDSFEVKDNHEMGSNVQNTQIIEIGD